jgi:hypothetical protein
MLLTLALLRDILLAAAGAGQLASGYRARTIYFLLGQ